MIAEIKEMFNFFLGWSPAKAATNQRKTKAQSTNTRSNGKGHSRKVSKPRNGNFHAVQFESRRDSDGVMRIYEVS